MENKDLLIKALRNALIQLKVYEMQICGYTDKEITEFSEKNIISIRNLKDKQEFSDIFEIMEQVGFDVVQKFDVNDISLFFGIDSISFCEEIDDTVMSDSEFSELYKDDPLFNYLMFHTLHEMITDGDYPDRIPSMLIDKSLEFFSNEEDFDICKQIKDFADTNKRLIVDDIMSYR